MAQPDIELIGMAKDISMPMNQINALANYLPTIFWIIILSLFFFIVIKFMTHRIFVEKLEKVKGGFISKAGRYTIARDKKTELTYLKPMWGSEKLPYYPHKYYQKINGAPFFGIKRELSLIKKSNIGYEVLLPPNQNDKLGIVTYFDTLDWYFIYERQKFLSQHNKAAFWDKVTFIAPLIIILGGMICFTVAVFLQIHKTSVEVEELKAIMDIAMKAAGK